MNRSIYDPHIPYIGPILTSFNPGKLIRILGTVPPTAYRFNVALQCGPETLPQDDIVIQVAVHVLDGFITLNSLQSGIWGEERRIRSLSIKHAERFEIVFICEYRQCKILINRRNCWEITERIHYDRISHLVIDGDVSIIKISYEATSSNERAVASIPNEEVPRENVDNQLQDFEVIPSTINSTTTPPNVHLYFSNASDPPSYTEATSNSLIQSRNPPYSKRATYPSASERLPYPIGNATGMPYPTNNSLDGHSSPDMQARSPTPVGINVPLPTPFNCGSPHIPVPINAYQQSELPPGAPVPLNAGTLHGRPRVLKRFKASKTVRVAVWLIVIIIMAISLFLITRFKQPQKH